MTQTQDNFVGPPTTPQPLPAELDPKQLMDKVLQEQINKMTQRGGLRFSSWGTHARPAGGWNLQAFRQHVTQNRPSTPEFDGADAPMAWLKIAEDDIKRHEGSTIYAYHGALSAARAAGKKFVTPGDAIGTDEVSVGYGFNLTQPGGKGLFEKALEGQPAPSYDDVVNGRKAISRANADRLQEYMVLQKNAMLEKQLAGHAIKDHQRAALVSMLYQGVGTKAIVEAIKAGKPAAQVADMIVMTGDPRFRLRRRLEASRFMGAGAQGYFDNSTNQLPGRTDADTVSMKK